MFASRAEATSFFDPLAVAEFVSVPARQPIKPVYVRRFGAFIEAVRAGNV
jgi:hypothetical protein